MLIPIPPTQDATTGHTPRQPRDPEAANPQGQPGRREHRGFTALPNAVLFDGCLSRGARLLYALLQAYARQDSCCYPSQATLTADLGTGETQLRAYLHELLGAGLVTCRRRGQGRTNLYYLPPAPDQPGSQPGYPTAQEVAGSADQQRAGLAGADPVHCNGYTPETTGNAPLEPHWGAHNEEYRQEDQDLDDSFRIRSQLQYGSAAPNGSMEPHLPASQGPRTVPPDRGAARGSASTAEACATGERDTLYRALVQPIAALRQELGDAAPLRSTISRAYNLLIRSGQEIEVFLALMEEARQTTLRSRGRIARRCSGEGAVERINMMPYCFGVLEGLVRDAGLAAPPSACVEAGGQASSPTAPEEVAGASREIGLVGDTVADPTWQGVLEHLRGLLAPHVYARFRTLSAGSCRGDMLCVVVPDRSARYWFETRLRRVVEEALRACAPPGMRVEFMVAPSAHSTLPLAGTCEEYADKRRGQANVDAPVKPGCGTR